MSPLDDRQREIEFASEGQNLFKFDIQQMAWSGQCGWPTVVASDFLNENKVILLKGDEPNHRIRMKLKHPHQKLESSLILINSL